MILVKVNVDTMLLLMKLMQNSLTKELWNNTMSDGKNIKINFKIVL